MILMVDFAFCVLQVGLGGTERERVESSALGTPFYPHGFGACGRSAADQLLCFCSAADQFLCFLDLSSCSAIASAAVSVAAATFAVTSPEISAPCLLAASSAVTNRGSSSTFFPAVESLLLVFFFASAAQVRRCLGAAPTTII